VSYVCLGATIRLRAAPAVVRKGGALFLARLGTSVAIGLVAGQVLGAGPVDGGVLQGLSVLAIVAAMNNCNGGLYMALMGQLGRDEDAGAYSLMSIESGLFLTMVTLGIAGVAAFPLPTLIGAILPITVGVVLGNLDSDLRAFLGRAVPMLIPFFAFALGARLDLLDVWRAGTLGVLLGVAVLLVNSVVLVLADRLVRGDGTAGLAAAATAGNAAATPSAVAAADPAFASAAPTATALVGASVIVTAMLVPMITTWWVRRVAPVRIVETDDG